MLLYARLLDARWRDVAHPELPHVISFKLLRHPGRPSKWARKQLTVCESVKTDFRRETLFLCRHQDESKALIRLRLNIWKRKCQIKSLLLWGTLNNNEYSHCALYVAGAGSVQNGTLAYCLLHSVHRIMPFYRMWDDYTFINISL